ncbi:cytochrome b/b6 domain-containing protein [Sulfitobacter sabulilitoris]|uniref:Cytochrome n=1 Tax=Sulfitobacter sabulilitoris TaxID=2562655 RepID=A0A5S3PIY1_9RHOB|nr:cytochrome b/b6 domain-containing protein [Sulfitobacter sabulilitoris]TMM54297.1 cytochrome [Sulfitobacter sabulilitoris]
MSMTNDHARYGTVSKTFHWLTALLILTLIPLGLVANAWPYDTSEQLAVKALLFSVHKTFGVTVFFVALLRIAWAISQPKPGLLHADRKLESWAAETAHWVLYGSLIVVPLSGWIHHAATTGFAPIWWPFGQSLPFIPKDPDFAEIFAGLHEVFVWVLIVTLAAHIGGALKHHVIDRDATLRRMLPGQPSLPKVSGDHPIAAPIVTALAIWAAALVAGASLGLFAAETPATETASLDAVASQWQVEDGKIEITVQQMGSAVTGSFADWTAAIAFDETVTQGPAGSVEVTIAIGSLKLGSVTDQAMGADFFNAEAFPTATFTADILAGAEGYTAEGKLSLKDSDVPVSLPFTLAITDDTARMQGNLTLDRRDFGIGQSMKDESSVGFSVAVDVAVTASKSAD